MGIKEWLKRHALLALERPSIIEHIVAFLLISLALLICSEPGMGILQAILFLFSAALFGGIWVLRGGYILLRTIFQRADSTSQAFARIAAWAVLPVAGVLCLGFAVKRETLLAVRLSFSEKALLDYAQSLPQEGEDEYGVQRHYIGLFHVTRVRREGSCVLFTTGECFLKEWGLVYSPEGCTSFGVEEQYMPDLTHIYGPWWSWHGIDD